MTRPSPFALHHSSFAAIWAIARNTVRQAIRIRVAFVIMAVYVVLVPMLPLVVRGDGTLRGLLHVAIAYSLIMAGVLLGILTLALSTTTLWTEIREKQIYLLESRPVHRWEVLLGKLVGILLINAGLIAFMGVVTWGCVEYHFQRPRWGAEDRRLAREQVLTARRAFHPEPPNLAEGIQKEYEYRKQNGLLPPGKTEAEIKKELYQEALAIVNSLPPRRGRVWRFRGLPASLGSDVLLTIRFKFFTSLRESDDPILTRWLFGKYRSPRAYSDAAKYKPAEMHEVQVPASAVEPDGVLEVHVVNVEPRPVILVFSDDDIQVLVPVTGFAGNLARGLALIFVEVLFLAVLGLFCSTFLSFPVSPIVAIAVLVLIYVAGILQAELIKEIPLLGDETVRRIPLAQRAVRWITAGVRAILPPFDRYSPSSLVSSGEEVSWRLLAEAAGLVAIVRGGLLLWLGMWIFQRREIAGATR